MSKAIMPIISLFESSRARAIASCAVLLATLVLLRTGILPVPVHAVISDVANTGLNDADLETQTRNYYRQVSDVNVGYFAGLAKFLTKIGLREGKERGNVDVGLLPIAQTDIVQRLQPYLPYEFKPSYEIIHKGGYPLRTNRWAMRDKDYEQEKPADTFRIALIGASNSMGSGVAMEETYLEVLEDRLNAELAGRHVARFEALNFSVGGYDLTDRLYVTTTKIPQFEPDVIFVVVLGRDLEFAVHERIADRLSNGVAEHFAFIRDIAEDAGVTSGDRPTKIKQRLRPYRPQLIKGCAEEMLKLTERTGIPVYAVVLNLVAEPTYQALIDTARLCESTGVPTIRLFNAYVGYTGDQVYLSATDRHPTPLGHRLIAVEFYSIMLDHPALGPMIRGETRKDAAANAP